MTDKEKVQEVAKANAAWQAAGKAVVEMIQKQFPIGTVVWVQLGNSRDFPCRITGHPQAYWYDPDRITGVNCHTGKTRRFTHRDIVWEDGDSLHQQTLREVMER
jgi:hypothetical protein